MANETTFLGEFEYALDKQRRFSVPKSWRSPEGPSLFYLLPGRGNCLQLISEAVFSDLKSKIRQVSFTNPTVSKALAQIGAMAQECLCDKQGRIALSPKLKSYAKIDSEITLVGAITTAQIWSSESWKASSEDDGEALLDVIDKLFASNDSNDFLNMLGQ